MERSKIKIETVVSKPIETLWEIWTLPKHIMEWNSASDDWYTPSSENDLRVGGTFSSVMSARDGSFQFEFGGIYDEVIPNKKIAYTLGDGRKVDVTFEETTAGVRVTEIFEAEGENSLEMQKNGWQSILDHFKRYAEALA
jgi:uncharacterized protein YndB with AHSA1/START domain